MPKHQRQDSYADVLPGVYGIDSETADVTRYSRENYGTGATGPYAHQARKRRGVGKRIAIAVACVLAVLVIAGAAYAFWFSSALDAALAPSDDDAAGLKEQLVSVPLDQPFYMLVLGSDSREGSGTSWREEQSGDNERSDVIMLVRIDAPNKKVTMVSVPRDTPYTMADGSVVKINEMYNMGGAAAEVKAVSDVTGARISHYAEVRVSELEAIVDAVGGVDVYVDRDLSVKDTLTGKLTKIDEGYQHLDGREAQVFARARHEYKDTAEGQDYHRQSNVRTLAEAILKRVLSRPMTEIPGTILSLAQYGTTDLKSVDLVSLGTAFAGGKITMYSCCGPINGDLMDQYDGLWMCYENPEGWAELMRQVDEGIEPGDIDYAATEIIPGQTESVDE